MSRSWISITWEEGGKVFFSPYLFFKWLQDLRVKKVYGCFSLAGGGNRQDKKYKRRFFFKENLQLKSVL
jgi:hypothetical protein